MMNHVSLSLRLSFLVALVLLAALAFASLRSTSGAGPFVVTRTDDPPVVTCSVADCSLREAIIAANAAPGTITVPAGTYTLTIAGKNEDAAATGDLDITGGLGLNINGAGAATTIIDGGALDRVFHIRSGTVSISGVTIRNGSGTYGAGIYNNATLNLTDSTVSGNTATSNNGGGIYNNGTMTVTNSTISGNAADGHGGGIYNSNSTTLSVTNSTISGNTASGTSQGGGIYNNGPLNLTSSTISGNTAGGNGGGILAGTAGGSHLNVKNTIIAGNTGPVTGPDCFGAVTSQGHNLIQTVTAGCVISGDNSGNITGQAANLSPLALNSPGTTETQALLPNSPAIDAGSSDCPPPAKDQRGVARPLGVACDIGAYESPYSVATPSPTPSPSLTPSPTPTPSPTATPIGQTPSPTPTPTPVVTPTPTPVGTSRIWGDEDCGGDIGPRDAQAILKNVLVQNPLSQTQPCPAVGAQVSVDGVSRIWGDVDCGGDIGPRDAQAILKNVLVQNPLSQTQPCPAVGSTVQVVG
jgi:CSLREA domain-containing protein